MCARNECDNTRLRRLLQIRARSRVQVTVEFNVVLRVVSLDLGFTLSLVSDASTSSEMVSFVNCISPRIRNTKCKVLSFWML